MNIEKALTIDGWMNPKELEFLAENASKHTKIAEIGSWMGRSTCALLANTLGKVYAIDTWNGTSSEAIHRNILKDKGENFLYNSFLANTCGFSNLIPVRSTSAEAAVKFAQEGVQFDMIFIDAAHDYENVKADIEAWLPLLAPDGIFCGHDYTPYWHGAVQAVKEKIPHFEVCETIWYTV